MIKPQGKYYIYRHIRKDKNEPFYIGIGTKSNKKHTKFETEYQRSFETHNRNKVWKGMNKDGFEVEILLESDDKNFIEGKEIEFIELYGRLCRKDGTLANLHRGGNYKIGHKLTEEHRKCIGDRSRGSKSKVALKVINLNNGVVYDSISEASLKNSVGYDSVSDMIRGKANNNLNLMLLDDFAKKDYQAFDFIDNTLTKVINVKTMLIYESIKQASAETGIKLSTLMDQLENKVCMNRSNLMKYDDYLKGKIINEGRVNRDIYNTLTGETYFTVTEASKCTGISYDIINKQIKGVTVNTSGLIYIRDYKKGIKPHELKKDARKIKIINTETKEIFNSIKEVCIKYAIKEKSLASSLRLGRKNLYNLEYYLT